MVFKCYVTEELTGGRRLRSPHSHRAASRLQRLHGRDFCANMATFRAACLSRGAKFDIRCLSVSGCAQQSTYMSVSGKVLTSSHGNHIN